MAELTLTRAIEASPATVCATITDHRAYPEMRFEVEVEALAPLSGAPTALLMRAALARLMAGVGREVERRDGAGG